MDYIDKFDTVESDEDRSSEVALAISYTIRVRVRVGGWNNYQAKTYTKFIIGKDMKNAIEKAGSDKIIKREIDSGREINVKIFTSTDKTNTRKITNQIKEACSVSDLTKKKKELLAKRNSIQRELKAIEKQIKEQ